MWKVGDQCLAQYSGDGTFYPAVINRINERREEAVVKYCDYSSDENETIPLANLKRNKRDSRKKATESSILLRPSFVSPLRYLPEEVRLRDKYADLDKEIIMGFDPRKVTSDLQSSSNVKHGRNNGNKMMAKKQRVAFGGKMKVTSKKHNERMDSPKELPRSIHAEVPNILHVTDVEHKLLPGFTQEELEKPYFPGIIDAGPKVPFVLSGEGTQQIIQIPGTINRYLREYQREGVRFLFQHFLEEKGAILADDMGLGKTIQVLALICAILHKKGNQGDCQRSLPLFLRDKSESTAVEVFLIVCPNSVLYNWLEELETWTYCSVGKYHGKDREETLAKASRGRLDVVVTTFETYRVKLESLLEISWTAVIVDEVHKIKENNSQITVALKKINTSRRYGLTGTPLQNKMGELWCLLDWANPGCLGSWKEFKKKYETSITKGQRYDASKRELAAGRQAALEFSKLRGAWLLRRTKSLISDQLPMKDEKVVFCKLTDLQINISRALLNSDEMKLVLMQHDPCDCGSSLKKGKCHYKRTADGLTVRAVTFSLMSALIKAANHAALLLPSTGMTSLQKHLSEKISKVAFAGHPEFVKLTQEARFNTLSDPHYCGKMKVLERLLDIFAKEGSKVLLFSYYTKLLDILEMYLRTTGYVFYRLDGKTPASERQKLVNGFNRDKDVFLFLISTKAGGMGLNLTGANVVVIFDPNWNPMYDLQAQDRAYRIGQHRDVRVYRLISTGCIEENMYLRQVYKQQLSTVAMTTENAKRYFTAVAGEDKQKGELFGIENLFTLRTEGSCLTRDLIQREVKTEKGITMAKYIPLKMKPEATGDEGNGLCAVEDELNEDSDEEFSVRNDNDSSSDDRDTHGIASQLYDESTDHESPSEEIDHLTTKNVHKRRPKKRNHLYQRQKICNGSENCNSSDESDKPRSKKGKTIIKRGGKVVSKAKRTTDEHSNKGELLGNTTKADITNSSLSASSSIERKELRERMGGRKRNKELLGLVGENDDEDHEDELEVSQSNENTESVIFRECGVAYVHSNLKVIGASRVEDHVSKTALADVYDNHQYSQEPAFCRVPTLEKNSGSESDDIELKQLNPAIVASTNKTSKTEETPRCRKKKRQESTSSGTYRIGERTIFVGQTPMGIRREQFKDMAKVLSFTSVDALASAITTGSEATCVDLLVRYYKSKYPSVTVETYLQVSDEKHTEDRKPTAGGKQLQSRRTSVKVINTPKTNKPRDRKRKKINYRRQRKKPEGIRFQSDHSDSSEDDVNRLPASITKKKQMQTTSKKILHGFDEFEEMKVSFVGAEQIPASTATGSSISDKMFESSRLSSKTGSLNNTVVHEIINENIGNMCNTFSSNVSPSTNVANLSNLNDVSDTFAASNKMKTCITSTSKFDFNFDHDSGKSSSLSFLDDIFFSPLTNCSSSSKPPPSSKLKHRQGRRGLEEDI